MVPIAGGVDHQRIDRVAIAQAGTRHLDVDRTRLAVRQNPDPRTVAGMTRRVRLRTRMLMRLAHTSRAASGNAPNCMVAEAAKTAHGLRLAPT
ncbi:hypothetical protein QE400_004139 [Xanthomonas sacchari]|uniref:hypothetical protein n=1 Tax=Xanthomonas sacchari TaxID=56458 RepID=UPI00278B6821|nr:hypothetical protein [Xanthomonas sacchari]MDQ1094726.1 hypothetical protein [Xanthomonas sacchari]